MSWRPVVHIAGSARGRFSGYSRRSGRLSLQVVPVDGSWYWAISRDGTVLVDGQADTSALGCEAADLALAEVVG